MARWRASPLLTISSRLVSLLLMVLFPVWAIHLSAEDVEDEQAARWLQQAEEGSVNALFNLGQHYRKEDDINRAIHYYQLAAERGHDAAQLNLGSMFYFALPTSPDIERARYWWTRAAERGNSTAAYQLGMLMLQEATTEQQQYEALRWIDAAAQKDVADAQALMESIGGLPPDPIADEPEPSGEPEQSGEPKPAIVQSEPVITQPPAGPEDSVGWFVQVGALNESAKAARQRDQLAARITAPPDIQLVISEGRDNAGRLWHRIRYTPFEDSATARAWCATLQAQRIDCFVNRF